MKADFAQALSDLIRDFADDPGISDEEIIEALEEEIQNRLAHMKRLEGD